MNATTTTREILLSNAEIAILHRWEESSFSGAGHRPVSWNSDNVYAVWLDTPEDFKTRNEMQVVATQKIVDGLVEKGLMTKRDSTQFDTCWPAPSFGLDIDKFWQVTREHRRMWEDGYYGAMQEFFTNNPDNQSDWWEFNLSVTL